MRMVFDEIATTYFIAGVECFKRKRNLKKSQDKIIQVVEISPSNENIIEILGEMA